MKSNALHGSRLGEALERLDVVASRQHQLFTYEQAIECGVSPRTVCRYVAEGRWRRPHRNVYVVGSRELDDVQRGCAAVLAGGPAALLSHMSAVALHGLAPWPLHVDVTVPHGSYRKLDGVRWHQSRVLDEPDRTLEHGIPVTTPERSLLDAATQADRKLTIKLVDECVRLRKSDVAKLAARALEVRPDGRFGGARLRAVLARVPPIEDADSVMEMLMARLLTGAGFDGWVHHLEVDAGGVRFELDFAFPQERVDVECDGAAYHAGPMSQVRDRRRDEALAACGWRVLRFSWKDVTADAARTSRHIRDVLRR